MTALMLALIALSGCNNDNNERQRLVAEADLTNGGGPLVIAHFNDNGTADPTDDYIPIESLSVLFSARPLNDTMMIVEDGPYSTFNVTNYDLIWRPGFDAPAALTDYNVTRGNLTVTIPVDSEVIAGVLVGNISMKNEAWFPGSPFTADLTVIFYGHESGSQHEVALTAGTTVQFIDTASDQ